MKIDFKNLKAPTEPTISPPPNRAIPKGEELEGIRERMRKWLREYACKNFIRASGDCLCSTCGEQYRKHPTALGAEWLHRLCNEVYVKL